MAPITIWIPENIEFLRHYYPIYGKMWCAKMLKLSEPSIRAKASKLHLSAPPTGSDHFKEWQSRAAKTKIGKKRPEHAEYMRQALAQNAEWKQNLVAANTRNAQARMADPVIRAVSVARLTSPENLAKAVAGMRRPEIRQKHRENTLSRWQDPEYRRKTLETMHSEENRQRASTAMSERIASGGNCYSRTKSGKRNINGREQFFRSCWEANVARVLDFQGRVWQYESRTFVFETVTRGTRTYTPDFYLPEEDLYIEVKGWWDAKSLTKQKRMAKHFPKIKIEYWDKDVYRTLERQLSKIIVDWEA